MQKETTVKHAYDDILMHRVAITPFKNLITGTDTERKAIVGIIWRYVIDDLLEWDLDDVRHGHMMTPEIISDLKLDQTLPYADILYSPKKYFNIMEVLQYAYPDKITFDFVGETIKEYDKVSKRGVFKNDQEPSRFRKGFFENYEGEQRLKTIFGYAVNQFMDNPSPGTLFAFFADQPRATKWLTKHKINRNIIQAYNTPLDLCRCCYEDPDTANLLYLNELLKQQCTTYTKQT